MGLSNYPDGVTGNEPQISGVWPIESVVDSCQIDLNNAIDSIDDVVNYLDDQGGFTKEIQKDYEDAIDAIRTLKTSIDGLIEEPDYEDLYDQEYDYRDDEEQY